MALSDIRRSGKVIVGQNDKKFIHVHVYERKRASIFAFAKKYIIIIVLTTFQRFKSNFRKKQKTLLGKEIQTIFLRHE